MRTSAIGLDAQQLLHLLTNGHPHREVYRGRDGGGFVTYGGGETTAEVVESFIDAGHIKSVYSSIPTEAYHVGRTWDCERTMEARKKHGKGARNYFVGDV